MLLTENGNALIFNGGIATKRNKMKIKILKQTVANKETARLGDILEVSDAEGTFLCHSKKAVAVSAQTKLRKAEKPEPAPAPEKENKPDAE